MIFKLSVKRISQVKPSWFILGCAYEKIPHIDTTNNLYLSTNVKVTGKASIFVFILSIGT